ncbi:MAG: 4-phosphoerythronate dehydrogenase, partial [Bacteroidales bacterium]|nr:4-phosphoerythronate dehydrogenase [Bacteroidales bacterium]
MKIVIDERIPYISGVFEPWADVVYSSGRAIDAQMVADADALIVRTRTRCDHRLLAGSKVRIVASATIGFDHLDTAWLEKSGIRWVNAPGCNSGSVMQYITAALFLLALKHSLDLPSLTLGVVGVGNVGSKVVRAAKAIGMKVMQNDPPRQRREGGKEFLHIDKLLAESDILTLHVPLTLEGEDMTRHLINSASLTRLKRNCILINTSRGEVVDNTALRVTLEEKKLLGAVLDVWEGEPETDRRLVELVDVATPHIAGYSVDGKANATINSVREVS